MEKELANRSGGNCELCGSNEGLTSYTVAPKSGNSVDDCVHACSKCNAQLTDSEEMDANHWRCLNDSMWSEVDAVKVVAWRTLTALKSEGWPNDLLEMMYMDEDAGAWAKAGQSSEDAVIHLDSNGVQLNVGDSVVLIKDLKVKGGGFTAKRGTAVRNISLVHDNPEHIEGKVEGQKIVILTQYVKK
ncbi:MAG: protein PhnA [Crocinitomicaceae bacterium]|jgi:protein PhnA